MRLSVEKTELHRGWDSCVIDAGGRVLLQGWNYQKADRFSLDGKALALPYYEERRLAACGTSFVFLGHEWGTGTAAKAIIVDGKRKRREVEIPRKGHEHHFLAAWLAEDRLALVASDTFHVVHGIAITEVTVAAKRAKQAPIMKVAQLDRHIGKGHASLSLETVMRRGGTLYAIASAGYRYRALLELEPKAKTFGSRVIAHRKADQAVFSAGGEHVVFYERKKPAQILGLDGTIVASVTIAPPAGTYYDLVAAAPGRLGMRRGDKGVTVFHTQPWPRGDAPGVLADVPASAPIADLPLDQAAACSPEPVAYRGGKPSAFAAVTGWYLNADPVKKKPVITHAIVTDVIINFFATTKGKLRLLFNFDLSAIEGVAVEGQRVTITTPSGTTILMAPRAFAKALIRSTR